MATPQVLIIGLDGATWRLFEPWARTGRLPHLAALMARGTWGTLRSTVPALTLPAWASFMTGKNPGAHGVFGFRRFAPDRYEPGGLANASDLRAATLWDLAGRAGRRVGVVNVPPSYPIRPVNGYVVSCMLTPPGEPFTDPPEVAAELGDYQIDIPPPGVLRRDAPDYRTRALTYLHGMREQTRQRGEAVLRVMQRRQADLVCVVFYAPDRIQHYFWHCLDPTTDGAADPEIATLAADIYTVLDEAVGRLVAAAGPDATTVIISDHGFVPKPARAVHINRWLADQGLVARRPFWTLRRKIIRKLFPAPWRQRYDTMEHILVNRARTRAWAETIFTGTAGIWVHVAGRYPLGCVAPGAEYEAVRRQIAIGLGALHDERGRRVFRCVERREDLYRGPYVAEAPDLLAVCEDDFGVVFESLRRELREQALFGPFEEQGYTGTHDPDGIYLAAGPPIGTLGAHEDYPIESIAPTVLHLLGLPVPRSMEGPVCTSFMREEFLRDHPVRFSDDATDAPAEAAGWRSGADEAKIADHLRALGYLE
jgi:predicted AlkP superfamily phosphohydrolase/phosphomutase